MDLFGYTVLMILGLSILGSVTMEVHNSPSAGIKMVTIPDLISNGLTKHLEVNCSVDQVTNPDMAKIMSIILSKSGGGNNRGYQEVASLTAAGAANVSSAALVGASASGLIRPVGASHLSLTVPDPGVAAAGLYMCQVYAMDTAGHPVVRTTVSSVMEEAPSLDVLLKKLKELETKLDEKNSCCDKLSQRLHHATDSQFEAVSDEFNGKRYYMSKLALINQAEATFKCRLSGGILAEIDDEEEFKFVKSFIDDNDPKYNWVALGGSDEKDEGKWVSVETGRPLNYTNWYSTNPDGGVAQNCMYLSKAYPKMYDEICAYPSEQKFLCEMPADLHVL